MSSITGEWEQHDGDFPPVIGQVLDVTGKVYAPFLLANAAAIDAGEPDFSFEAMGLPYIQSTFKYQVKCLADLRKRCGALRADDKAKLARLLNPTLCLGML